MRSVIFTANPGGWSVVSKLQRVMGIAIVLIMLLGSIGNVAMAQQGGQTETSTQSGAQRGPVQVEPTVEPVVEEPVVEEVVVEEAEQETVVEEETADEPVVEEEVVEEPVADTAEQVPAAQAQTQQVPANAQSGQAPVAQEPVVEETPVVEVAPATTEQTISTSATSQTRARAQSGGRRPGTTPTRPTAPKPTPPPAPKPPAATGPLRVVVDLSQQMVYVYRGSTVINSSLVNTGKAGFRTPTGTFYINSKYRYDDMRGREGGESWDVRNVPYAMYFTNRGHALHGAPWSRTFGTPRSHGCVNLPMGFAAWLYNTAPIGTRVVVQN